MRKSDMNCLSKFAIDADSEFLDYEEYDDFSPGDEKESNHFPHKNMSDMDDEFLFEEL